MGIRDTFFNAFSTQAQKEARKQKNAALMSARDYLRNGNRDKLYPTWSDIAMPDQDMYRGYSYAVIQKRGNKVATLAKDNLKTWAKPEVIDEFQKKEEEVEHPYLKLIYDSTKFTEKQFWKNISIYLDLAGRYYLGVVRSEIHPTNPKLPIITTDPTEFIMLNPYEIRRVINAQGEVAGYIERKSDGRYREWPLHQIIEMRELNPFDPDKGHWAMTDAAKSAVYTMNQSSDYTVQSLHGNIEAPGIITTDVMLSDPDFDNFRRRVAEHKKGEPLFGNGSGSINWTAMQIDLDKAALMDINEINRTTLFAVSGTSKTSLGIEQSGTTRETARVQSEQFVSDTAQPRLEDIVDFLNLDYKRHYRPEYKKTGYYIEIKSAVGTDYATETQAVGMRQAQIELATNLMNMGYTQESAYQYATGDIELTDLELEEGLDKPQNPEQPGEGEDPEANAPTTSPDKPQGGSDGGNDKTPTSDTKDTKDAKNDLNDLQPHSDLITNGGKGSGNFGHAGRVGEKGGSAPSGSGLNVKPGEVQQKKYATGKENWQQVAEWEEVDDPIYPGDRIIKSKDQLGKNPSASYDASDAQTAYTVRDGRVKDLFDDLDEKDTAYYREFLKKTFKIDDTELDRLTGNTKKKNSTEGESCDPLENLETHDHCVCETHDHKIETYVNQVGPTEGKVVNETYDHFLEELRKVEKETIDAVASKLTVNAFAKDDLLGPRKKKTLLNKLRDLIYNYWGVLLPLFAVNHILSRNREFKKNVPFLLTNAIQKSMGANADKVAEGHLETILNDVLEATNRAYTQVAEEAAAELIITAYEKTPGKFGDYFAEMPTRKTALEAVQKTDILEKNRKIYEEANRMAYEGYSRQKITKAIREKYDDISKTRANTIARNETARVFSQSQYEADLQFLNSVGKLQDAYKVLYSRRPPNEEDKICPYCRKLIDETNENPVPFEEPFLAFGNSIEVYDNGKTRTFTANYEDIQSGTVHVNCQCSYKLVFKNAEGEFIKTLNNGETYDLRNESSSDSTTDNNSGDSDNSEYDTQKVENGGEGSGNFGHGGRPGEVGGSAPKGSGGASGGITKEEEDTLAWYVSGDGMWINQHLRGRMAEGTSELTEDEQKMLDTLTNLANDKIEPRPLYRSVEAEAIFGKMDTFEWEALEGHLLYNLEDANAQKLIDSLIGKEITEKGFMSTSKDRSYVGGFGEEMGLEQPIVLEFEPSNNTRGIDLAKKCPKLDEAMGQSEVILKPGAKYEITDIRKEEIDDSGVIYVKAKLKNSLMLNGGPGSGNFGHAGRPGEVGGSAPNGSYSASRSNSYGDGDIVKGKDKDGNEFEGTFGGVAPKGTTITIKMWDGDHEINVRQAIIIDKDGNEHLVPFASGYIKKVADADEIGQVPPAERRTEAQKEALNEVFDMITCSAADKRYLLENCAEDTAIALRDELKKAKDEYGIDLSEFTLGRFNGTKTQARVTWKKFSRRNGYQSKLIELSNKLIADGEGYKKKMQEQQDVGWHTGSDIASLIKHELGHIKAYQVGLLCGWYKGVYDYGFTGTYDNFCAAVVRAAGGSKQMTISKKGARGDMSQYGATDRAETVAEAFSNPDYSALTKKIVEALNKGGIYRNEAEGKVENKLVTDTETIALCDGYPMTKIDWEIVHGQRAEDDDGKEHPDMI